MPSSSTSKSSDSGTARTEATARIWASISASSGGTIWAPSLA